MLGRNETQGSIRETGDPLNLAIEGDGYFQVKRADGKVLLTRDGTFGVDASGTITNSQGNRLEPPIKLPAGVSPNEVRIGPDGTVKAGKHKLGQIQLVTVTATDHLLSVGTGELTPTARAATARGGYGDDQTGRGRAVERRHLARHGDDGHDSATTR